MRFTNLVEQNATSSRSQFLEAKFSADLQAAEELSDKLAKKAEFDAEAASTKAAEAAQAVADQQAAGPDVAQECEAGDWYEAQRDNTTKAKSGEIQRA